MGDAETFVIVGAGLAGAKTAEALRERGFDGRILLIGDEPDRPYERPALSKDFLQGRSERDKIYVHAKSWYADHEVDLRRRVRITAIDRARHRLERRLGEPIGYDRLLLATGASPRPLTVPGSDKHRVFYLRRVEDSLQLKFALTTAKRVAIVGAGWIGLEVAAAARAAGADVTVLESATLPLLQVLGPECAEVFAQLHRQHGVDLRLGVQVVEIAGDDPLRASGVRLADGTVVDADLVVIGVGAVPNTELARAAGLAVDDGIRVDEHLRTSEPDIFAAGDVANCLHPRLGKHIRVDHWANARDQPVVAAGSMLGLDARYERLPYFYSNQYDMGMEYFGYVEPGGYDEVVFRGDKAKPQFVAFWLKERRVKAAMNVNIWDQADAIQALVHSDQQVDTTALASGHTPLTDLFDPA